jgi:hypothetical protein
MRRIIVSLIVLVLLGVAGLAIYLSQQRDRPAEAPDLTLLNESLHRTMEGEMGPPSLTQNLVELTIKQQDLESEVERIKNLAARLGGNAVVNHLSGGSDQDLLVEIPETAVQQFIEAVQDRAKMVPEASPDPGGKTRIVEVKLHATK